MSHLLPNDRKNQVAFQRVKFVSHDHIMQCTQCGTERILNDCACPEPLTYFKCGPCMEESAYEHTERMRNVDY